MFPDFAKTIVLTLLLSSVEECQSRRVNSFGSGKRSARVNGRSRHLNLTVCWILEEDSYYSTYDRLAAAVDLAMTHANEYILPENIRLQLAYQNAGPSCSDTQYSVTANVMQMLQEGTVCDVFLGVGKFEKN